MMVVVSSSDGVVFNDSIFLINELGRVHKGVAVT